MNSWLPMDYWVSYGADFNYTFYNDAHYLRSEVETHLGRKFSTYDIDLSRSQYKHDKVDTDAFITFDLMIIVEKGEHFKEINFRYYRHYFFGVYTLYFEYVVEDLPKGAHPMTSEDFHDCSPFYIEASGSQYSFDYQLIHRKRVLSNTEVFTLPIGTG